MHGDQEQLRVIVSRSPEGLLHRDFCSKGVVSKEDGEAADALDSL